MRIHLPVWNIPGEPLSGHEEVQLEGLLRTPFDLIPDTSVVTSIQCADGAEWVIDDAESPYQVFAARRVMASGHPCTPHLCHRIEVTGHFAVSKMRLVEVDADVWLTEVGT